MSGPAYATYKGVKHVTSDLAQACGMEKDAADYIGSEVGTTASVFVGVPTGDICGMIRVSKENFDAYERAEEAGVIGDYD